MVEEILERKMRQFDYTNIEQFTPQQLEDIVREYPWFSYARELMLVKLAALSREIFDTELRHSAIFLSSRERLYQKVQNLKTAQQKPAEIIVVPEPKTEDVKAAAAEAVEEAKKAQSGGAEQAKIKYIAVGGDYFSREDFEELEKEEGSLPSEAPRLASIPRGPAEMIPKDLSGTIGADGKVNFNDPEFYTETLGQVYAQQGYYEQAIEVFSKLILLYPQKSAYFAALVKETECAKKDAMSGKGK